VPADHGLGFHDDQGGGPFPPQLREPDPEGAIKHPKARALAGALVRGELLTQGEIFQDERLSMDEEAAQEASEQGHPGILAGVGKSNDFRRDGVFADYDKSLQEKRPQVSKKI
jgi:hypothetical protein